MEQTLQTYLLQAIKQKMPPYLALVDILQEKLGISQASAYRRANGETNFSLEELVVLCRHFNISIDEYLDIRTENVLFQYYRFVDEASFKHYLQTILERLHQIANSPEGKIISADDDLPILQHFRYPEHTAFKIYYWLLSMLAPTVEKPVFSPEAMDSELLELAQKIYDIYIQIPTTEIWTQDCANTTIKQIQYCQEMNLFASPSLADLLKQQFLDLLIHIENCAITNPHFQLYLSEMQIDNNCIWAQSIQGQEVFIRHQSFNVVHTESTYFCEDTHVFLKKIAQQSILLSGTAEKKRRHFFQELQDKANLL
jgi:hypothetical protein